MIPDCFKGQTGITFFLFGNSSGPLCDRTAKKSQSHRLTSTQVLQNSLDPCIVPCTQARSCDHCVILRRIKFNRRIRIKSRRMVSVMKVKFDRHKGRVFFTGEFYQELAGNSIRILFLYASHFQDGFDAVGTQRNLAAASFCAMFPRKIHAKDGRFIRRITDNAHTNAVNQPAEAFSCLQHLQNVLVLNATHDFCECYQTLIVQENRKSVGFCIGASAADGLIYQDIQSLSLGDGIPWSNSLITHLRHTFS